MVVVCGYDWLVLNKVFWAARILYSPIFRLPTPLTHSPIHHSAVIEDAVRLLLCYSSSLNWSQNKPLNVYSFITIRGLLLVLCAVPLVVRSHFVFYFRLFFQFAVRDWHVQFIINYFHPINLFCSVFGFFCVGIDLMVFQFGSFWLNLSTE